MNTLNIVTRGLLSNSAKCVATRGFYCFSLEWGPTVLVSVVRTLYAVASVVQTALSATEVTRATTGVCNVVRESTSSVNTDKDALGLVASTMATHCTVTLNHDNTTVCSVAPASTAVVHLVPSMAATVSTNSKLSADVAVVVTTNNTVEIL